MVPERVFVIAFNACKRGRGVHVPEGNARHPRTAVQHTLFQHLVKYADAAVLDHQIAVASRLEQRIKVLFILVHNRANEGKVALVRFLLAAISIRFSEGDLMSKTAELAIDAAI